jgi:hypothetical protein
MRGNRSDRRAHATINTRQHDGDEPNGSSPGRRLSSRMIGHIVPISARSFRFRRRRWDPDVDETPQTRSVELVQLLFDLAAAQVRDGLSSPMG